MAKAENLNEVKGQNWHEEVGSAGLDRKEFRKKFYEEHAKIIFGEKLSKILKDPSKYGLKTFDDLAEADVFSKELPEKYEINTGQTFSEFLREYFIGIGVDEKKATKEVALTLYYLAKVKRINVDLTNAGDVIEIREGRLYIIRKNKKLRLEGVALRRPTKGAVKKKSVKERATLKKETVEVKIDKSFDEAEGHLDGAAESLHEKEVGFTDGIDALHKKVVALTERARKGEDVSVGAKKAQAEYARLRGLGTKISGSLLAARRNLTPYAKKQLGRKEARYLSLKKQGYGTLLPEFVIGDGKLRAIRQELSKIVKVEAKPKPEAKPELEENPLSKKEAVAAIEKGKVNIDKILVGISSSLYGGANGIAHKAYALSGEAIKLSKGKQFSIAVGKIRIDNFRSSIKSLKEEYDTLLKEVGGAAVKLNKLKDGNSDALEHYEAKGVLRDSTEAEYAKLLNAVKTIKKQIDFASKVAETL